MFFPNLRHNRNLWGGEEAYLEARFSPHPLFPKKGGGEKKIKMHNLYHWNNTLHILQREIRSCFDVRNQGNQLPKLSSDVTLTKVGAPEKLMKKEEVPRHGCQKNIRPHRQSESTIPPNSSFYRQFTNNQCLKYKMRRNKERNWR